MKGTGRRGKRRGITGNEGHFVLVRRILCISSTSKHMRLEALWKLQYNKRNSDKKNKM